MTSLQKQVIFSVYSFNAFYVRSDWPMLQELSPHYHVLPATVDYISGQAHTWKALYAGNTWDRTRES